jgi:hypothetical protein
VILIISLIDGIVNFKIWISSESFGNKLFGKLLMNGLLYALCYYVLGVKESNYTKYEPLRKVAPATIFSFLFLGFLTYITKKAPLNCLIGAFGFKKLNLVFSS